MPEESQKRLRAYRPSRPPGSELIAQLIAGEADLGALAQAHFATGDPLRSLASWYRRDATGRLLGALRALSHDRADLCLARSRARAASALLAIALDESKPDSARKACVDLLKLVPAEQGSEGRSAAHGSSHPGDEKARVRDEDGRIIRRLLQKFTELDVRRPADPPAGAALAHHESRVDESWPAGSAGSD